MKPWKYKKALITGASSGLGEEFALQVAALGCDVILVARRRERLESVAKRIVALGRKAKVVSGDLELPQKIAELGKLLQESQVDLLINNAGYGKIGPFSQLSLEDNVGQIMLNVLALTELSHHAVKAFKGRGGACGIINVASTASFTPIPNMAVYAATKAFVRSFSLALSHELRDTNIQVTALLPGPTATEFFDRAGESLLTTKMMTPRDVVQAALRALQHGDSEVVPGALNNALGLFAKMAPDSLTLRAAGAVMKNRPPR